MYAPTHPVHAGKYDDPDPEVNYLRPKKPSPSPTLTPTPHHTNTPHPCVLLPIMWIPAAAVVQKRNAHAKQRTATKPTHKNPPGGHPPMPIHNQDQATALVQIIHAIRATRSHGTADWHPKAIEKTLFENRTHQAPYGEIVVALTRYAKDSDKRVPSFLFDALADWAPPGNTAPRNPCEDHPTHSAHSCPSCRADVLAGIRPKELIGKKYEIPMTGID